jgi:hypothetical protein
LSDVVCTRTNTGAGSVVEVVVLPAPLVDVVVLAVVLVEAPSELLVLVLEVVVVGAGDVLEVVVVGGGALLDVVVVGAGDVLEVVVVGGGPLEVVVGAVRCSTWSWAAVRCSTWSSALPACWSWSCLRRTGRSASRGSSPGWPGRCRSRARGDRRHHPDRGRRRYGSGCPVGRR